MEIEASSAYPVSTLRDYATSLKAALSICMGGATPRAVHRIRTRIRRIEAQLVLLDQITRLPLYKEQARKLRRHLKRLRKIAARVGDLDVQCELIGSQSAAKTDRTAKRLISHLRNRRERKTPALQRQLRRSSVKIGRALGLLFATLGPDKMAVLSATKLIMTTQRWFQHQHPSASTNKQLHATRKAARTARYMAEGALGSATARNLAKKFESIQQAGGDWHDWFLLSLVARKRLRKDHHLVQALERKREKGAEVYREKLLHKDVAY